MKRLAVLAIVCCAMVMTSCHKPQEFYNASIDEYQFTSHDNETSAKAVLGTINFWQGQYAYSGMTADISDVKAIARYNEAILAISLHANELAPYFEIADDYFVYTLKRTTDEEVVLLKTKFYKDTDGEIHHMTIYDATDVK